MLYRKVTLCAILLAVVTAFLGTNVLAEGQKARALARSKIQKTFQEVLGREATEKDIEHHMGLLENGIKPMEMRKNIVLSDEGTRAIQNVFKEELGREPKNKQLTKARTGLIEGQTLSDLRRALR